MMTRPFGTPPPDDRPDEKAMVDLIRLAGRRPEPAAFRAARVRLSVEREWRTLVHRRRMRRAGFLVAAAAAAALAVGVGMRVSPSGPRPADAAVARVARVAGPVQLTPAGLPAGEAAEGLDVRPGAVVETGPGGGVALVFANGGSVRIGEGARVTIGAASRLSLEQGRLYVDSTAAATSPQAIEIATRAGTVREIGTQFEVRVVDSALVIRVREGIVRFEGRGHAATLREAEFMRIEAGGPPRRGWIATHGADWAWLEELALPFRMEGATLPAFLEWVCRERGLKWRFADSAAAKVGQGAVLHGSIDGLTPAAALDAVLPATGLEYRQDGGELVIGLVR
jgi:ferric-dicitrate binding protein FerR (iron transport regulator)